VMLLLVGAMSWRAKNKLRTAGGIVLVLVLVEFSIGIAAIAADLPIGLAVAHNWLAGMLLLAMLKIVALNRSALPATPA
jgi:heme A synthase